MKRQDDLLKESSPIQVALDEADRVAVQSDTRLDYEQVFDEISARIYEDYA